MLRQALQSAPSPVAPAVSPQPAAPPSPVPAAQPQAASSQQGQRTIAQTLIGWAPQVRQIRELGISDDIVIIQALEATNGDVQAALNIIFSDMN